MSVLGEGARASFPFFIKETSASSLKLFAGNHDEAMDDRHDACPSEPCAADGG